MVVTPLLPFALPDCTIDHIRLEQETYLIDAHRAAPSAVCPDCHQESERVHSWYVRHPHDLPISTWTVRLHLRIRRFFCDTTSCSRRTFAEQIPAFLPAFAQRTSRLTQSLQTIGHALGGQAGDRLAHALHMPTSHDTLLRIVHTIPLPNAGDVQVIGIDDFAFQKGHVYGTIIVDLAQRRPLDILPDRRAETFAAWLTAHPTVTTIVRDRLREYARGASIGAPNALQVADRWHLLVNHREALERLLNRLHDALRPLPMPPAAAPATLPDSILVRQQALRPPSGTEQAKRQATHARRMAQYTIVRTLAAQGLPYFQIAQHVGMDRRTVQHFATATVFPERAPRSPQPRMLDPYLPYLAQRWQEGCTNASQMWRELKTQGYPGGRSRSPVGCSTNGTPHPHLIRMPYQQTHPTTSAALHRPNHSCR